MSYVHQAYPSTRYHRDGSVVGVNDPAHEQAVAPAEDGWADTPAAFDDAPDEDATEDATPKPTRRKR
jgi:ferric-dicitrate binding protein FerR (iron transport regulator)